MILSLLDRLRHPGQPEARIGKRSRSAEGHPHAPYGPLRYLPKEFSDAGQRVAAALWFLRWLLLWLCLLAAAPAQHAGAAVVERSIEAEGRFPAGSEACLRLPALGGSAEPRAKKIPVSRNPQVVI